MVVIVVTTGAYSVEHTLRRVFVSFYPFERVDILLNESDDVSVWVPPWDEGEQPEGREDR